MQQDFNGIFFFSVPAWEMFVQTHFYFCNAANAPLLHGTPFVNVPPDQVEVALKLYINGTCTTDMRQSVGTAPRGNV